MEGSLKSSHSNPFYNGGTISVDKERATGVVYLDSCEALDRVLYNILFSKLERDRLG